ncbi:YifB family Mg chelatase-like AAA ATPase [Pollutimonas harenae]|uniref:YifB family Mg chelatase-like AAA ATPase n=1 Tax=Pollutimonas harenae TaxID=657015 RepID=A0A853GUS4_9BURK|nr:YifB family Mg chelatase-like AAA ATPase [Pollutimonas harenae]NYT85897.1 YifB family Mg chelatase-like AAA ATPase [Pollutimonas harenae]TEA70950.1 ATP-binding protein [Pollutimonas harenae]
MSLAVLASRALCGLQALPVRVEVHMAPGLPAFHVVGLPDAGVRESRERVRSAILSSGFEFPAGRLTVNLAPADLPKESGRFDLPIALGILLASGQVAEALANEAGRQLHDYVFAGELSLTGAVTSVAAPLAIALAVARSHPGAILVLPAGSADHAALVPGLTVLSAGSLLDVALHVSGVRALLPAQPSPLCPGEGSEPCLSEVRGQALARRVLEIAAAGGHSLLMSGPPGTGKSMLAHRLPGLLPRLEPGQALEASALASLNGQPPMFTDRPPFRSPHHSASVPALVGGGAYPRPGEISLAHQGVLFLDELPEFQRRVLESLREPLETGCVTIARASRTLTFPANFQLVAAMNPCPCGWLGHKKKSCRCTPDRIEAYRSRLSGPLLDRVDLQISLPGAEANWIDLPEGEDSSTVRLRVLQCRTRQQQRQCDTNARLSVAEIGIHCRLDDESTALLARAMQRWNWSARVVHRILRVSRTLADMSGADQIGATHIAEAVQYRLPWDG